MPKNIEYTSNNEVSIVYQTKIDFDEFISFLNNLVENQKMTVQEDIYPRIIVREALTKYLLKNLIIDPLTDSFEDSQEMKIKYAHKAIKDLIGKEYHFNDKKQDFSKKDIEKWFLPRIVEN